MTSFVISRRSSDYNRMMTIYNWCVDKLGPMGSETWDVYFAFNDEPDYVRFSVYDNKSATMFALMWSSYVLPDDENEFIKQRGPHYG